MSSSSDDLIIESPESGGITQDADTKLDLQSTRDMENAGPEIRQTLENDFDANLSKVFLDKQNLNKPDQMQEQSKEADRIQASRENAENSEKEKFESPSHQRAVELMDLSSQAFAAGQDEEGQELKNKAFEVAQSMGESGRYYESPFSPEKQAQLHEHFQIGSNEHMLQQEMRIGGEKDADMCC